jgi:alkanesulfonate monooxygenase SsuD/methylene tetrahydromethanopterin reductase-like flavin-dependent oxidoreductase (luciferase family)
MVAIIGGETHRFRPLIDLYREAGKKAGFTAEQLKVGVHLPGYVAENTAKAMEEYYPGYARIMTKFGKERGWPAMTSTQFERSVSLPGALLVGGPEQVAEKIRYIDNALGGITRLTFQMDNADLPNEQLMESISLIGTAVKKHLAA